MRWVPLLFASRFSVPAPPGREAELIASLDELVQERGQVPKEAAPLRRTYGPRWAQFLFYHPFVHVSRTLIEVRGGRLHYTLDHPAILLVVVLVLSLVEGPFALLGGAFALVFHTTFLFFVHRELLLRAEPG